MRKFLALLSLGILLHSTTLNGFTQQEDDEEFFNCPDVCVRDVVQGRFRFVQFINNSKYYYECRIDATNGAEYKNIVLASGTLTRPYRINDSRADWIWSCESPKI